MEKFRVLNERPSRYFYLGKGLPRMMAGAHFETEAVAAAVGSRRKISRRQETGAVAGSGRNCARMSGVEGRRQEAGATAWDVL